MGPRLGGQAQGVEEGRPMARGGLLDARSADAQGASRARGETEGTVLRRTRRIVCQLTFAAACIARVVLSHSRGCMRDVPVKCPVWVVFANGRFVNVKANTVEPSK